jgi:hypothetical protein
MALRQRPVVDRLTPILDEVARAVGREGISPGDATGSEAVLRIEREQDVRRVVQVYWTGFEVDVPGESVGLHIEVAEPRVHWAECYLSPEYRSWFFAFFERTDGEIQLAYHAEYSDPRAAVDGFFDHAGWHVLTPTDKTWDDVVYQVSGDLEWNLAQVAITGSSDSEAIQESLKKSTILWLRWDTQDGIEQTMPVWYVYDSKVQKLYVLSGERQQTIPGAESLKECVVIFRWKGRNARVGEIPASVRALEHGPEWDQVAEKIAEKRLNIPGLPEDTARRWRDECTLLELTLRN